MPEGAVVVRSADPELQLQGLRTALSLALGDRSARLYLAGAGAAVFAAGDETEAGKCLLALREARVPILVDDSDPGLADDLDRLPLPDLLAAAAAGSFQQTF